MPAPRRMQRRGRRPDTGRSNHRRRRAGSRARGAGRRRTAGHTGRARRNGQPAKRDGRLPLRLRRRRQNARVAGRRAVGPPHRRHRARLLPHPRRSADDGEGVHLRGRGNGRGSQGNLWAGDGATDGERHRRLHGGLGDLPGELERRRRYRQPVAPRRTDAAGRGRAERGRELERDATHSKVRNLLRQHDAEDGGRQIFEDDTIFCYLGRGYGGSIGGTWIYAETTIYSLRLYNRPLNEDELKSNYDKTIAEHNIN